MESGAFSSKSFTKDNIPVKDFTVTILCLKFSSSNTKSSTRDSARQSLSPSGRDAGSSWGSTIQRIKRDYERFVEFARDSPVTN